MHQVIQTRYLGPTNSKGSRVKAKAQAGQITIGWDNRLNVIQNHTYAAKALCNKLGWEDAMIGGSPPCGTGYVWVVAENKFDKEKQDVIS